MQGLPPELESALEMHQPIVAFSGSRILNKIDVEMLDHVIERVRRSVNPKVMFGDGAGVDEHVYQAFPYGLRITRTSNDRSAYALRSMRLSKMVAKEYGNLIAFPGNACPSSIVPTADSRLAFNGSGTGTWSTTALAMGSGARVFLYLSEGVPFPEHWQSNVWFHDAQWVSFRMMYP